MSNATVLYDALGPQGLQRMRRYNLIFAVVAASVGALLLVKLGSQGQLSEEKWGPITNPANPHFELLWTFMGGGVVNTAKAATLAIVASLIVGTALAVTRVTSSKAYRWLVVSVIEVLRAVPVVLLIFFVARVLPEFGIHLPTLTSLVIGLTLYNGVVIGEIIRAGIQSLPRGQTEAAQAIGLSRGQTLRLILLPQAFRIMLPALIGQLVVVVKETSLGFIISFEETLRRGQIAIQSLDNPLQLFLLVALIFIAINLALSKLARCVEQRNARRGQDTGGRRRSIGSMQQGSARSAADAAVMVAKG